jgi:hypothetical protein
VVVQWVMVDGSGQEGWGSKEWYSEYRSMSRFGTLRRCRDVPGLLSTVAIIVSPSVQGKINGW